MKPDHVRLLNDIVTHLKDTATLQLLYPRLNKEILRLYAFADSCNNTNADCNSQPGVISFVANVASACHFLHWRSSKCPRTTKFMLPTETYAFSKGCDYGISLRMLLGDINCYLPLYFCTDTKSIF